MGDGNQSSCYQQYTLLVTPVFYNYVKYDPFTCEEFWNYLGYNKNDSKCTFINYTQKTSSLYLIIAVPSSQAIKEY